jgi:hypothetical protein
MTADEDRRRIDLFGWRQSLFAHLLLLPSENASCARLRLPIATGGRKNPNPLCHP